MSLQRHIACGDDARANGDFWLRDDEGRICDDSVSCATEVP